MVAAVETSLRKLLEGTRQNTYNTQKIGAKFAARENPSKAPVVEEFRQNIGLDESSTAPFSMQETIGVGGGT